MTGLGSARVLQFRKTGEDEATTAGNNVALVPMTVQPAEGLPQTFSIVYQSYSGTISTESPQIQAYSYFIPASVVPDKELSELRERVRVLEEHITAIEDRQDSKVIVLRTITRDEAKSEILNLFQENAQEVLDYGVIAQRLRIDLEVVVNICSELEKEGIIG